MSAVVFPTARLGHFEPPQPSQDSHSARSPRYEAVNGVVTGWNSLVKVTFSPANSPEPVLTYG